MSKRCIGIYNYFITYHLYTSFNTLIRHLSNFLFSIWNNMWHRVCWLMTTRFNSSCWSFIYAYMYLWCRVSFIYLDLCQRLYFIPNIYYLFIYNMNFELFPETSICRTRDWNYISIRVTDYGNIVRMIDLSVIYMFAWLHGSLRLIPG